MADEEIARAIWQLQPRVERAEKDLASAQIEVERLREERIRVAGRIDQAAQLVSKHQECLDDHEERLVQQERRATDMTGVMARLSTAVDNLAVSVENVQPHKPVVQQAKEAWDDSSRKTKLAVFATVLAFINAPEIFKELAKILARVLAR